MQNLSSRNKNIIRKTTKTPDGIISSVHFGNTGKPIKLVFLHANGFNALAYRTLLEPLADKLDIHIAALDQRGHGHTNLPAKPEMFASFNTYANDILAWLEAKNLQNIILAGHSLGASTSALAAAKNANRINKIACFDTIVLPLYVRAIMGFAPTRKILQKKYPLAKAAGRRRYKFADTNTAFNRYRSKGLFKKFSDETLRDYVDGGFLPDGDNVRLACHPEWEKFTYTAQSHDIIHAIKKSPTGSIFIYTDFINQSRAMHKISKKRPDLVIKYRKDLDHFFPLINQNMTRKYLQALLQ